MESFRYTERPPVENRSQNLCSDSVIQTVSPVAVGIAGVAMAMVMLVTLFGNGLVVLAVISYHRLRSVTNYFVVSLAVADLTVALFVMPFSALFELETNGINLIGSHEQGEGWRQQFGWAFCYFWISCDVTCCTSSILHLCVIAVERYLAIAHPLTHAGRVSRRRAVAVIAAVWMCSIAISFLPIYAGWFAAAEEDDFIETDHHQTSVTSTICGQQGDDLAVTQSTTAVSGASKDAECSLRVNAIYAVVSSGTSFYLPLIVMTAVYAQIYRIARRKADEIDKLERSIAKTCVGSNSSSNLHAFPLPAYQQQVDGKQDQVRIISNSRSRLDIQLATTSVTSFVDDVDDDVIDTEHERSASLRLMTSSDNQIQRLPMQLDSTAAAGHGRQQLRQKRKASRRDSKAVKTLGTLMGLFCICWCPFFLFYVVQPFCPKCVVPEQLISAITWLGYGNSAVNPFVYAYLNRDFRAAYRRLIGCRGRHLPARRHGNGTAGRRSHMTDGGGLETSWSSTQTLGAPATAAGHSTGSRLTSCVFRKEPATAIVGGDMQAMTSAHCQLFVRPPSRRKRCPRQLTQRLQQATHGDENRTIQRECRIELDALTATAAAAEHVKK